MIGNGSSGFARCGVWMRFWLIGLFVLLQAGLALAQAPEVSPARQKLDGIRAELSQIETALENTNATDAELQRQRQRLAPLQAQLRELMEEQAPRVDQAKSRLDQLGPKPDGKGPAESADVAQERATRERVHAEADEMLRIGRAAQVQADQLQASIADRRRDLFARTLFAPGQSLLSPALWEAAAASFPEDVRAFGYIFGGWLSVVSGAIVGVRGVVVGLALLGALLLYVARARYLPRVTRRLDAVHSESGLRSLRVAFAHIVAGAAPPALASWLIYTALNAVGLLPLRIAPVIAAVVSGLAIFAFVQALADAIYAPDNPQRRLVRVVDRTASAVVAVAASLAAVMAVAKVLESVLQAIAAGLAVSIIVRALLAIAFAIALFIGLYRLREQSDAEEECALGPYVPVDGASLGPVRILGWAVALLIIGAAATGYVVFASFVAEQVLWIGIVAGLFLLAYQLIDLGIIAALTGKGRFALTLRAGVGIRGATLEKIAVVVTGLLKVVLVIVTLMLVAAPWGLESADFVSSARAAFFGVQVGGVTISLSTIIIGAVVLAIGVTATRAFQGWLDGKFLPTTRLDTGLRNSITTAAGYLGYFAAAAFAISSLGFSLERVTIVAGALSVGIGFGLQSVVSNFVSGLILLWERPIRVGDQVLVGDAEGIVRRINVRSTEIDTFDRSTVIVPNSNLITGVVRNRVRSDRSGRVLIAISVPRSLDPGDVRTMLAEAAAAHGDVQQKPPPAVMFRKIGTATLDFELICVVPDVDMVGRVTSDLNFVIFKRLVEMEPAAGVPEMMVRGLDGVEQSLGDIAGALRREPTPTVRPPAAEPRRRRRQRAPDEENAEEEAVPAAPAVPAAATDPESKE